MTDRALIDRIARAVLYEGYLLYPYRRSSLKNQRPWTFGILYSPAWAVGQNSSDRSEFRMECLLRAEETSRLSLLVRFLHLAQPSSDAVEREASFDLALGEILEQPANRGFGFGELSGAITLSAAEIAPGVFRLALVVANTNGSQPSDRDAALPYSLLSAHAALSIDEGQFVSSTDPPAELADAAAACVNTGVWPVLLGEAGATSTILAAPIILPDYPQVARESAGDLYDATEIEEILTLRILTLTDEEKAEVRGSEERARRILKRTESVPREHLMRLHGTIRGIAPAAPEQWSAWDTEANAAPSTAEVNGCELKSGDRVRLRPTKRADIFDSALEGRVAIIETIERDFEDQIHLAVVLEDDPGRDLGEMRHIGHRFFFSPSEVEPIAAKDLS